ncbi:hypothetical protein AHAS_Ahas11G0111400 [Arachis hypogaea]
MGGGNAQKSKMARERNLDKQKAAAKGSQLETNKKAMSIQCKVCMQTFICTTSEVKCREHAEAKHPKSDLYACFPHLKKSLLSPGTGIESCLIPSLVGILHLRDEAKPIVMALMRITISHNVVFS